MRKMTGLKSKTISCALILAILSGCGRADTQMAAASDGTVVETEMAESQEEEPDYRSSTDLQTVAKAWADAFCTRDGDALWELFDPERKNDFYAMGFVQSEPEDDYIAIGWSSPWPMDYLYTLETDGEKTLLTYYPMTSNPHRWVWKQSVSWQQKDGRWYGYQDSFVTYDTIRYAGDFADAYSGGISGTPMDYRTDCEGWEDTLENLAEEEGYKTLLTAPDKAAEYLLNLADGTGTIKWMEDQTAVLAYQFEYGDQILITMRQPEGKTIWLPEDWEEKKEETSAVTGEGSLAAALAEKAPSEENTPLEISTDEIEALPAAYGKALWDVYRQGILPDGHQLEYTDTGMAEENQFAVCDVDGDGRKELLIRWSNTVAMAGMAEYVLDSDGGQCYTELSEYPSIYYYDNGSVEADWSHNQGKAGRIWPKNYYCYNAEKDIYESFGSMDAWDKSLQEEGFPDDIDADGDGLVYYLLPADWEGDYEKKVTVDGSAYEAWRAECVGEANLIRPAYQELTPENIESLGFLKSE